jgi:hypothetical protein
VSSINDPDKSCRLIIDQFRAVVMPNFLALFKVYVFSKPT